VRFLSLAEVIELHARILLASGGASGIRDLGALEAAVAQPRVSFDGRDLYEGLAEKAAALGFSLICNHPFVDGNKRVGHAAIEAMAMLNGYELAASVDDSERTILALAASQVSREELTSWVRGHLVQVSAN